MNKAPSPQDNEVSQASEVDELNHGQFSAAVTALSNAFGDPRRREIYLFVRDSDQAVTAAQIAESFSLHPNVARHHLEKLCAGGYLEVSSLRETKPGAGRPSKRYQATKLEVDEVMSPSARMDDLLVLLLARSLAMVPQEQAEQMAEEVGAEYGRNLADHMGTNTRSHQSALHSIAAALTAHGFAAHTEARGGSLAIIADHCPFGDAANQHPVICAVDRGIVRGMLSGLCEDDSQLIAESRARGDNQCITFVK